MGRKKSNQTKKNLCKQFEPFLGATEQLIYIETVWHSDGIQCELMWLLDVRHASSTIASNDISLNYWLDLDQTW